MRAGKLTRLIEVQRSATAPNDVGTPVNTWSSHKRLRAEVVDQSTGEFLSGGGDTGTHMAVFRVRYVEDLLTTDRVLFTGKAHDIQTITEIGRREGLELRCTTKGRAEP